MSKNVTGIPFVVYPVTDLERARDFYGRIIGLQCTMDHALPEEGKRWIEFAVGPSTIAISNAVPPPKGSGVGAALEVKDLDGALETLQSENVGIRTGVMESAGCRFFVIGDPDGNDLRIHQHKRALNRRRSGAATYPRPETKPCRIRPRFSF